MKRLFSTHWPTLMMLIIVGCMALISESVRAAPFLTMDPIPINTAPNVRTEYRIDGGAWQSTGCIWVLTAIQRDAYCDLAATDKTPTASRKYESRYLWDAGLGGDGAIYDAGVTAASAPFSAPWRTLAAPTVLAIVPTAP